MALFFKAPLGAVSAGSAFSHPNDLAYSLGLLARWTSGHTKAQDVEPARRHVDVAKRRQAEPGGVVPAATPEHPEGARFGSRWICHRTFRMWCVVILKPFPNVSVHVVQAPSVWFLFTNRMSLVV